MYWDQITKGWKQLVVIVASARTAPIGNSRRNASIRAGASHSATYEETPLPPYTPDTRRERSDFSQHLSC
jgi:hypothetical protein